MDVQNMGEVKAAASIWGAAGAAFLSWLTKVHEIIQVCTALAAFSVAVLTARFYWLKGKLLKLEIKKFEGEE
jgi:hypothetical protein